jgi:hypothetical protein
VVVGSTNGALYNANEMIGSSDDDDMVAHRQMQQTYNDYEQGLSRTRNVSYQVRIWYLGVGIASHDVNIANLGNFGCDISNICQRNKSMAGIYGHHARFSVKVSATVLGVTLADLDGVYFL